jgi:uncharacterized phage protein (TIGR02216 family)
LKLAMRMGLAPEAFWRLSLPEWRALTEAPGQPALGRTGLEALIAAHPDGSEHERHL